MGLGGLRRPGGEDESVGNDVVEHGLHVLRDHIVPVRGQSQGLADVGQGQSGPGAGPLENLGVPAGGLNELQQIAEHIVGHVDLVHRPAQPGQSGVVHRLLHLVQGIATLAVPHHGELRLTGGVAQGEADGKAV